MKTAKVKNCEVSECAYNLDSKCHALAITVGGDALHPKCDTFCKSSVKGGNLKKSASVGACKVTECIFNGSLECQASQITVGYRQNEIDCLTFKLE